MKELVDKYVGKEAYYNSEGLNIRVLILDIKETYGRTRFQIQPTAGTGTKWVESVKLIEEKPNG